MGTERRQKGEKRRSREARIDQKETPHLLGLHIFFMARCCWSGAQMAPSWFKENMKNGENAIKEKRGDVE